MPRQRNPDASAERIAAAVPGATALPTGDDPRATVRAIEALMTRAGDLLSTSRAIELTNEPVPLDGGDRRVHAWILRIGAVGTIFVSEDGEDVGVREGEAWRTDLTADEREAVREAIAIARGRRRPALTPVPLAFDFGFPIKKETTDDTRLFTFTVEVPF